MYPVNRFLSSYEFNGWTVSLHYKLPHQGWKIHVSATYNNYQTVLNHVVWLAEKMDFSFKFASSSKLVEKLLDTHSVRESGGKLITILFCHRLSKTTHLLSMFIQRNQTTHTGRIYA